MACMLQADPDNVAAVECCRDLEWNSCTNTSKTHARHCLSITEVGFLLSLHEEVAPGKHGLSRGPAPTKKSHVQCRLNLIPVFDTVFKRRFASDCSDPQVHECGGEIVCLAVSGSHMSGEVSAQPQSKHRLAQHRGNTLC